MISTLVTGPVGALAEAASSEQSAGERVKKSFHIDAADAAATLEAYAEQASVALVYLVTQVQGVKTNAIRGEFTPREAIDRLLANTVLTVTADLKTGALVVTRNSSGSNSNPSTPSEKPSKAMKRTNPITVLATWLALTFTPHLSAVAAAGPSSGQAASTGMIEGRVFNAGTGTALANARVTIENGRQGTTTDDGGRFLLAGIPSGTARVVVDYIGMDRQIVVVDVPAGGIVQSEVELRRQGASAIPGQSDVVQLQKFTVVEDSEMSAQAVAINEQRNSANIKNVVALGEFGDRGSENIGEFLLFLPGVSIINSGAEADTISVRGIPSSHTGILLDGAQMATGENNTRTVSLRAVPMANISRVEVTKVPTPDAPASGLGGSINLISASGFDKRKAEFNYNVYWQFHNTTGLTLDGGRRWQLPETTAKFNEPSVDVRYTHPVNNNLALTVSAARTWRINPDQGDEQATWDLVRNVQTNSTWARLTQTFKTNSGQLGAEWRLSPKSSLTANLHYRHYQRPTTRSNLAVAFGAGTTGDASHSQGAASGVGSISQGSNWRIDSLETSQASLKFRHQGSNWRLDASAAWSESVATQEDVSRGFFNNANSSVTNLVIRGDDIPAADGLIPRRFSAVSRTGAAVDIYNGDNYSVNSGNSGEYDRDGRVKHARMDLTRNLDFRAPVMLKVGASINQEERDARANLRTWNFRPNGASDVASRRAGLFEVFDEAFLSDPPQILGVPYRIISHKKLYDLYRSRPEWFVLDEPLSHQNFVNNSREYTETISAGYLRADLRLLNKRLWIATGVRYEATRGKGRGPLDDINAQYQRDANGNFVRDAAGQRVLVTSDALALRKLRFQERGARSGTSYGDFYPSFNSTFDLTDKLVLRAAYARTIGRPNINFITPGITISDPDVANPRITVNNPDLKPWTADNFDLSLESYNFKDGVGSVGVFRKEIQDFFGSLVTDATPELLAIHGLDGDGGFSNYTISTQTNAGDARVSGFEFGYRQSLTFLPDWARGLQIFFNATRLQVKGNQTSDFSGFSPATYSGGINFIRARYYIKANYSFLGETRTSLVTQNATNPADTYNYEGKLTRIGVSAQYNLSRRAALYLSMSDVNAINKLAKLYAPGTPEFARGRRYQSLGYYTALGVKGTF